MSREPVFSLTANDFEWSYTRGKGKGGQKRNKTSSAVHCKHTASGAHGYAEGDRSQRKNREEAFRQVTESGRFQQWLRLEILRRTGARGIEIERRVREAMRPENLKIETFDPEERDEG